MKVRLKVPLMFSDCTKQKGEVADLPNACALEHIAAGRVEEVVEVKEKPVEEVPAEQIKSEVAVSAIQPEEIPAPKTAAPAQQLNRKGRK